MRSGSTLRPATSRRWTGRPPTCACRARSSSARPCVAGSPVSSTPSATCELPAPRAPHTLTGASPRLADYTVAGRLSLRPNVEVGLRHDGGHAENGTGMDVGSGLVASDAGTGLVRRRAVTDARGALGRGVPRARRRRVPEHNPTPSTPLGSTARLPASSLAPSAVRAEATWGSLVRRRASHPGATCPRRHPFVTPFRRARRRASEAAETFAAKQALQLRAGRGRARRRARRRRLLRRRERRRRRRRDTRHRSTGRTGRPQGFGRRSIQIARPPRTP